MNDDRIKMIVREVFVRKNLINPLFYDNELLIREYDVRTLHKRMSEGIKNRIVLGFFINTHLGKHVSLV